MKAHFDHWRKWVLAAGRIVMVEPGVEPGTAPGGEGKRHQAGLAAFLAGLFLLLLGTASLSGASVTLNPASDAYVNDSDPTGTYNTAWLVAGRSPAEFTPRYRSFLRFDVSGIPSNAIVSSALLRLNLQAFEGASPATIGVRRVLASWSSGTLTWNNQPALLSAPSASTAVGTTIGADYQWSVTGLVQDWVEGQFANNGLALVVTNETTATVTRTFTSLNHTNVASRPELVVTYALPADIAVTPTLLGFGNQRVGMTSVVQNVTVLNSGGSTLWISNVTSSSSQFLVGGTPTFPASLGPGASGTFQMRFAPTSPGAKNGSVNILSSDPDEPSVALPCAGTGVAPDINVLPASLAFATQLVGSTSSPQTVTIQNTGSANLLVTSIGTSSPQFPVSVGTGLPATIAPGGSLMFQVRFNPTGTGTRAATVTIASDDSDESTRTVTCTGAGVVPDIDVMPTTLAFGNQLVGSVSATQAVTIQNTGSADLHVSSVSSSSSQFVLNLGAGLPTTIAPGGNLMFGVRFTPTSVSAKSAMVTIASDDPDEATRTVSCTGAGVIPDIDVMPAALNFGNQLLGATSSPQAVTIQNTGSADLHLIRIDSTNSEFLVTLGTSLPATIAPGGSVSVQIRFAPSTLGLRSLCIAGISDDPDEPTSDVTCVGLGLPELSRSTLYDGSPGASAQFTKVSGLDSNIAMTIEAWVRRDDPSRTEAILTHNRSNSFWFGFAGPSLRFYRSGGQYADSTGTVAGQRWTHVAAAYDGSRVDFFIDGRPAGANLLGHFGAPRADTVQLGGDEQGANFRGFLDEVRLWDHSRSEQQIRDAMFDAAGPLGGLVALFPSGGPWEAIAGIPGQAGPGVLGRDISVVREPLRIPRAIFPMRVDGEIDPSGEYLGALQIVIRYDDGPDAVAYLVHDGESGNGNLYVAFSGLHDVPDGRDLAESWVAVSLDPRGSGAELASPFHLQFRGLLNSDRGQMFNGDGLGGFNYFDVPPATNGAWRVEYINPREFGPPNVEFRISKSADWLWRDTNRLMIGHFDLTADGDNFLAPGGVVWNSPATWPQAIYVENTNVVPRVLMSGHVFDHDRSHPVTGHRVFLRDDQTGETLATETTGASGSFNFSNTLVPPGHALNLVLDDCGSCRYLAPFVSTNNIQPLQVLPQTIFFPSAGPGTNHYAAVNFYLRTPVGPISLTGFTPTSAAPELVLREEPVEKLSGEIVRIEGTNFHREIQVFLYDCPDLPPQDRSDCRMGYEIIEVPSTNFVVGADGTWIDVTVPHVPQESWGRDWGWVVKDNWTRPGQVVWNAIGGLFGGDSFRLKLPAYPLVHGFEFDNEEDSATLQDFDGVFGNNAYICLGAFGECACRVRDPLYLLYYPIYDLWVSSSGGSCNGMASTSLLFAQQSLAPSSFEDGVNFAAGFTGNEPRDADDPPRPPMPPSYQDGEACVPWRPRNLWAHIRVNHGVQASAEFIQAALDQIDGGIFSASGNPHDALDRVIRDPWQTVISMVPAVGSGHVVTPYEVIEGIRIDRQDGTNMVTQDPDYSVIRVYDNNRPKDTNRFIQIMPTNREHPHGQYRFDHRSDDTWRGEGIFAIPLSVWYGERTAPGLLTALEAIVVLVFGDADALYTGADGGQWGWLPDGTMIDNLKGAKSISPLGGGDTSTRNVMLALPATNPPPNVRINTRGSHFYFHAAQGGRMLQLEQRGGVAGDQEQMQIGYETGRLASMRFSPERLATNFSARVGMLLGDRQRAVFDCSGLSVASGQAVEFKALDAARGVEIRNDTGEVLRPTLMVTWVDGPSANYGTNHFGPLDVPAGAIQTLMIEDWPRITQLRVETDLDRDGRPDLVSLQWADTVAALAIYHEPGNQVTISWPKTVDGFLLEAASSLNGPASVWSPVSPPYHTNSSRISVTVPAPTANRFYRLRKSD